MANFFTRLVERSLGLSPVVQPAIAPRFSSTPTIPDEANSVQLTELQQQNDSRWNGEVKQTPTPVHVYTSPLIHHRRDLCPLNPPFWGTLKRESWLKVPQNGGFRGLKPTETVYTPDTISAERNFKGTAPIRTNNYCQVNNSQQPILPDANPIAPDRSISENANPVVVPEPFRVLHPRERISVESHPSVTIAQPSSETLFAASPISANSSSQQDSLKTVPVIVSQQQDGSENRLAQAATQPGLRSIVPLPEFPQLSAESEPLPPTIRVNIGRVEVRAIMPTAPVPKAAPVRPRPAVSLNDYLKQRGGQS